MKKALALDALFESARLLTGATSAIYLGSKGVGLATLAELKMIQCVAGFLLELPTGLAADVFGKRKALMLSAIAGGLAFLFYRLGNGFSAFVVGELLTALCLALWSGAYEAFALEQGSNARSTGELSRFFHLNSALNSGATVMSGVFGGWIASKHPDLPYELSAFGMLLIPVVLGLGFRSLKSADLTAQKSEVKGPQSFVATIYGFNQKLWSQGESTMAWLKGSAEARHLFLCSLAVQALIQPMIYCWQPWFEKISDHSSATSLGAVFGTFQLSLLVAGSVAARLMRSPQGRKFLAQPILWLGFAGFSYGFSKAGATPLGLALFCGAEACMALSLSAFKARLAETCPAQIRASAFSALALGGRVAGFVSLGGVFLMLRSSLSLAHVYLGTAVGALIFAFALGARERRLDDGLDGELQLGR